MDGIETADDWRNLMRTSGPLLISLMLLTAPVLQAQSDLEQVRQSLSQGRYAKAARELQRIAIEGGSTLKKPDVAEERMLRGAIAAARKILANGSPGRQDAARQVLCLSRAYFPNEDLPGIEEGLRVGGGVQRPELIGDAVRRYPPEARRVGLQGVVIVEVLIDQEGCVRHPRVLKGLPFGIDQAALTAVQSWTFRPARLEGRPRAVYYVLTVNFSLKDR
jgi:TonB family protein